MEYTSNSSTRVTREPPREGPNLNLRYERTVLLRIKYGRTVPTIIYFEFNENRCVFSF